MENPEIVAAILTAGVLAGKDLTSPSGVPLPESRGCFDYCCCSVLRNSAQIAEKL